MTEENKPSITPTPDGPYQVRGIARFSNRHGAIESRETMYLCRCGASANKPFCDGTHKKIGFSAEKQEGRLEDRRDSYRGKRITIHDNRSICAHAGECTDNLASVFRMKQEPWIDPDAAQIEDVIATVRKCPSGALDFTIEVEGVDSGDDTAAGDPAIRIEADGPYVVTGHVELTDTARADGVPRNKYTLCRCGGSKNKPFCDGSHWHVGFRDDKN